MLGYEIDYDELSEIGSDGSDLDYLGCEIEEYDSFESQEVVAACLDKSVKDIFKLLNKNIYVYGIAKEEVANGILKEEDLIWILDSCIKSESLNEVRKLICQGNGYNVYKRVRELRKGGFIEQKREGEIMAIHEFLQEDIDANFGEISENHIYENIEYACKNKNEDCIYEYISENIDVYKKAIELFAIGLLNKKELKWIFDIQERAKENNKIVLDSSYEEIINRVEGISL